MSRTSNNSFGFAQSCWRAVEDFVAEQFTFSSNSSSIKLGLTTSCRASDIIPSLFIPLIYIYVCVYISLNPFQLSLAVLKFSATVAAKVKIDSESLHLVNAP